MRTEKPSSSQTLMSQDLGLDPRDPLNLLLHNRSQHDAPATDTDTDSAAATPPDWSALSMWAADDKMDPSFDMDFGGLMDMSFDPNVGIEPASLNYQYATDPFPPFTFGSPHLSSATSSESGSASPLVAYSPPSSDFTDEDPASELASRVRKTAGIMLAVQLNDHPRRQMQAPQRMHPVQTQQQQISQSPMFTTAPVATPIVATPTTATQTQSRPKTSHTTIERRYRTNLNARIQSLRAAVPALRVVDRAAAIKAGDAVAEDEEDVVDARGYVDGVKVARKCSKANVLGKAVEYIRVLKNREHRLARELAGLKTLLGGLVGGHELLREWEREWTARFGGPETDEVGESTMPVDEEADDEEDDSDEDGGRKRKKPKVVPEPKPKPDRKPAAPAVEGEKKKRGRPRKVVPAPPTATPPALSTSIPMKQEPQQQRQYLLGAFALFSFFANANVSTSSPHQHHAHEGHVLTRLPPRVESIGLLQLFHLFVSVAVLASVILPLGKSFYTRVWAEKVPAVVVVEKVPASPVSSDDSDDTDEADTDLSLSSISSDDTLSVFLPSMASAEAEACILNDSAPISTRIRTAVRLYTSSSPAPTPSPSSRRLLLALLLHPVPFIGKRIAHSLWGGELGLPVDEAARRISGTSSKDGVLRTLEESVAIDQLRAASAEAFVRNVLDTANSDDSGTEPDTQRVLDAARSLGGRVGVLAARVGRVLGGGSFDFSEEDDEEHPGDDVEKLLRATILYRRVFASGSAPATTTRDAYALRQMLGSSDVFEQGTVEEARDRVVDLLTGEQ
ncbi:hypothetical protein C8F01DRAFT_1063722 [Mycena amicta]|nr:hypothetical protein C8F01DRAFT_1063722 [Mycena amicta]